MFIFLAQLILPKINGFHRRYYICTSGQFFVDQRPGDFNCLLKIVNGNKAKDI
jgi:hypothetical protein